ncbi:interferon-induced 35 kDa protein [Hemicordylus capensis]|uniref:interferon-induced 35 kDa protein n=1 Tax=Hemicordylus capensis TaxID=884348 RepID=UPI0023042820|nr:interferon-induced 35 kDa protein [Hemicordylus capensis]
MTEQTLWNCQDAYNSLQFDRLSLETDKGKSEQDATRLQAEAELLFRSLQEYEMEAQTQEAAFQKMMEMERETKGQLLQEKQALEDELEHLEKLQVAQEKRYKEPPALPERIMVFKGQVGDGLEATLPDKLTVVPQIRYPVPGGSALVTFEDPEVAKRIIAMRKHRIQLDECSYVNVKVEPVELFLPSSLEISLEQSSRRVLVSGLEGLSVPEELLLDKLELFFSKPKNDGGEVEHVELLRDSGHVTLTFVKDTVAEQLVQRGRFQVPIGKEAHEVKVSPYVGGTITDLQFCPSVCARTVLLSGIPDVMEEELMCEALEIHFQKPSKGGGEVEDVAYNPAGHCAVAIFDKEEEEED